MNLYATRTHERAIRELLPEDARLYTAENRPLPPPDAPCAGRDPDLSVGGSGLAVGDALRRHAQLPSFRSLLETGLLFDQIVQPREFLRRASDVTVAADLLDVAAVLGPAAAARVAEARPA